MTVMRPIELIICQDHSGLGDNQGEWWTETVEIPADTAPDEINEAAIGEGQARYDEKKIAVAYIGVYHVPDFEDNSPLEDDTIYRVLRDVPVVQDVPTQPAFIPKDSMVVHIARVDGDEAVLVQYYPEGFYSPVNPLLYNLKLVDLEKIQ